MTTKRTDVSLGDVFLDLGLGWFEDEYSQGLGLRSRCGVFSGAMTMWLMISQRGTANNTLVSTVQQLKHSTIMERVGQVLLKGSKKGVFDRISGHPGGFSRARQRLELEKVEAFADYISEQAEKESKSSSLIEGRRFYVLDGSHLTLQKTEEVVTEFPCTQNQYGKHQAAARVVVAHNLVTGVACRPEIGTVNDSEQALSVGVMERLPKGSGLIADRNFGVFSVVWHAVERSFVPLVRLKESRAASLIGKQKITEDGDYAVEWHPTKCDRKTTELPKDAAVPGRVVIYTVCMKGKRAERFFFFTTARDLSADKIAEIYKKRWFIETDLRSIKGTMDMDVIHAKTPDMAKKEIIFGVLAYSLLRVVIARGARMLKMEPRQFSFSRARENIIGLSIRIGKATSIEMIQRNLAHFLPELLEAKLPKRQELRVEPRAIVGRKRAKFPYLHGTRAEARAALLNKRNSDD